MRLERGEREPFLKIFNEWNCFVIVFDDSLEVEYEFKNGSLEKVSKNSSPIPDKNFNWDLYNAKET